MRRRLLRGSGLTVEYGNTTRTATSRLRDNASSNSQSSSPFSPVHHPIDHLMVSHARASGRPVILWGTHHKTGTYLAQKIFALVCARMSWCCIFHPTR